jgi:hypothetical protein
MVRIGEPWFNGSLSLTQTNLFTKAVITNLIIGRYYVTANLYLVLHIVDPSAGFVKLHEKKVDVFLNRYGLRLKKHLNEKEKTF